MKDDLLERLKECRTGYDEKIMSDHAETIGCDCGLLREAGEEIERLRKDAERYRWLRKEHASDGPSYHVRRPSSCPAPHDLDADIDAAMTSIDRR